MDDREMLQTILNAVSAVTVQLDKMEARLTAVDAELKNMGDRLDGLEAGQEALRRDVARIERKIDRQGNDIGSQYQTGVYYTNDSARKTVERIAEIERGRRERFSVEIGPLKNYYPAEAYHQNYLEKNPGGYCHIPRAEMALFSKLRIDPDDYQKPAAEAIRDKLTQEQYRVTQESGTERPFSNAFWDQFEKGIYVDVVTGEPLFSSTDKFESGCGWPAFTKPIEAPAVVELEDLSHGMRRTEVRSRAGDSHLGHVFTGDPESPNGVRYCINSASLRFVPYAKMEDEGYGYLLYLFED